MTDSAESGQKRALMLCYFYPPVHASGTTRSLEFSKLMKNFGWEPVVLTVKKAKDPWIKNIAPVPEGIEIHRTSELNLAGLARSLHAVYCRVVKLFGVEPKRDYISEHLCLPDPQIAWLGFFKGLSLAKNSDLIYVSCSPFSSAIKGVVLKWLTGKPLVVDFRDAWSINTGGFTWIRRTVVKLLESLVIKTANILILNNDQSRELYSRLYPKYTGNFITITNGFDELNLAEEKANGFKILHVGNFYGERKPDLLFKALDDLQLDELEFVQVGGDFPESESQKFKCTVTGLVPREEALKHMKSASLLYLKQAWGSSDGMHAAVAAKTYEYLATGLPILIECPEGNNVEIVRGYCKYPHVVNEDSLDLMKAELQAAFANRHEIRPEILEKTIETFSRESLTRQLCIHFSSLSP